MVKSVGTFNANSTMYQLRVPRSDFKDMVVQFPPLTRAGKKVVMPPINYTQVRGLVAKGLCS